jgi:hypothetical protein
MMASGKMLSTFAVCLAMSAALVLNGGDHRAEAQSNAPAARSAAPSSIPMGVAKSVTRFFVTSKGLGKGGDLGGLAGADAHCQALAQAQGAGDHTWRAYLSTQATAGTPAVNARDRIGGGPWYNANGDLIAQTLAQLHGTASKLGKQTAVTEAADDVDAATHGILTGSRPDGTAFPAGADRTCGNWTASGAGSAELGFFDRGEGDNSTSWNTGHGTHGCGEEDFRSSGGAGLFYCFATN